MVADNTPGNAFPSDPSRAADVPPVSTFGTATASAAGAATAVGTTTEPTGTFKDSPPTPPPTGNPVPGGAPPGPAGTHHRLRPPRGGLRRLINSLVRIADLQYRIWLTQAKLTLQRMMLYAVLFVGAAILGLLAIIFLYIGVFKILTDVIGLRPVWAYLIYGGLHLALALTLVMVGTSILGKKDEDEDDKKDKKEAKKEEDHHDHA
jgi:hypothetical protein